MGITLFNFFRFRKTGKLEIRKFIVIRILMKGCQKKLLLMEIIKKLAITFQNLNELEITYAEMILSVQSTGVEHLLKQLFKQEAGVKI